MAVGEQAQTERRELAGERRLVVVRTLEGLSAIRGAWEALGPDHVAADPEFFAATVAADPKVIRPHVVLLERDGEPEALAVARVEQLDIPHKLGYRTIWRARFRAICVLQRGLLGRYDEGQFELVLEELQRASRGGEADAVLFRYLPVGSSLHRVASRKPSFACRQHFADAGLRWELTLPDSLDDFLRSRSRNHRKNLMSYTRRLEREFADSLELRIFERAEDGDAFFDAVETVGGKTYQRALGVGFADTPAHRARTLLAMDRGWFRGYVLYLRDGPVAFRQGFRYGGRFQSRGPGYDPEYARYHVGTYLLLRMIDDLCRDPGVRVLDFGLGDSEFKRRIATDSYEEGNVLVFAPTLRGVRLNLTRTLVARMLALAGSLARRAGVLGTAKNRWRRRLAATS